MKVQREPVGELSNGAISRQFKRESGWTESPGSTASEATSRRCGPPDGHGRLELDKFHTPPAVRAEPVNAPVNTLGIRRIMFAVDDFEDVLARLQTLGAELIGEVVRYEDSYRLCYVRGPEGIIVALAEELR